MRGPSSVQVAVRVVRIVCEIGTIQLRKWRQVQVETRSRKMREAFVRLGPAFTKIGQALATRRDILPVQLCDELTRLQDEIPASLTHERAVRIIESELGNRHEILFRGGIPRQPAAAASLGQVYKAIDVESGKCVAVKVQRENVREIVQLDAIALRRIANAFDWYFASSDYFAHIIDEVVGKILEETDYRREAVMAKKFADYFTAAADEIAAPHVYDRLSSDHVLTLSWIHGEKLDIWASAQHSTEERRRLIELGVKCTVRQFFERGFFHADPHSGNLLVVESQEAAPKLAYLDFGKMGVLTPQDRLALMTVLVHFVNRDAVGLASDFIELGCVVVLNNTNKQQLRAAPTELIEALEKSFSARRKGDSLNFQGVLTEVRSALPTLSTTSGRDTFLFRLPARFATIVRALGALEGTVLAVDPSFQVVGAAYPHVARALLGDASPAGRAAVLQLIVDTSTGRVRWRRLAALFDRQRQRPWLPEQANLNTKISLAQVVTDLGPDQIASLANDCLDYLATPAAFQTRAALADDLDNALRHYQQTQPQEDTDELLHESFRIFTNAPQVWLPFIMRLVAFPETHRFFYLIATRWSHREKWRPPALFLTLISRHILLPFSSSSST